MLPGSGSAEISFFACFKKISDFVVIARQDNSNVSSPPQRKIT
jgi:hypothetical protein